MSNLFRTGNWAFGRRESHEEEQGGRGGGGGGPRGVMEDESFDVGSNLPVYMSRKEAGEWHVPMDENSQQFRIMEDDEHDEKTSEVGSSVVSGSTVTESREFWLNCLKENGVDMNASYHQPSPRRRSSLSSSSPGDRSSLPSPRFPLPSGLKIRSPSRSPEPLAPRDRNSLLGDSARELDESSDDEKLFTDPASRTTRSSFPLYRENGVDSSLPPLGKKSSAPMERSLLEPPLVPPDRVTAQRRSKSPSWKQHDPYDEKKREVFVAQVVPNKQSPPEDYVRRGFFSESSSEQNVAPNSNIHKDLEENLHNDQPHDEATDSLPSEIYIKSSVDSYDSSLLGANLIETHTASDDGQEGYFAEIQAALTSGSLETNFTGEDGIHKSFGLFPFKVTTVRSTESDISSTGFTAPRESLPTECLTTIESETEKAYSKTSVDLRFSHPDLWTTDPSQKEETEEVKEFIEKVSVKAETVEPKDEKESSDKKDSLSVVPKNTGTVLRSSVEAIPRAHVQKTCVNKTESPADDLDEPKFVNDEYSWMYLVWYKKGLMKTSRSLKQKYKSLAVQTGMAKVEKRLSEKNIPTPKDALISLDYQALQADDPDESFSKSTKRQSLPADVRMSAQKESGRKSFDNIRKMWQTKTDDRPNSFFSPERYMNTRRQSHNPGRSRPTQHTQLLSIAERTAMFENVREVKRTPPIQGEERKVTPRSMSVDSAQKLAGSLENGSDSKKNSRLTYSPTRDLTIEEQLQSNRRKSHQPVRLSPPKKEVENKRRETLNPIHHLRRPNIGRSSNNYKSMIKKDYKSIVRTFLASVEEHRVVDEDASQDNQISNLKKIERIPKEIITNEIDEIEGLDTITPKNLETNQASKGSVLEDSPWTQQVVSTLENVPIGSDGKTNRWRHQERPWREDLVKRKVSDFSECVSVAGVAEDGACTCSASVFSGNDELIEFFLPLMGMACNCGRRPLGLFNPEEPTSLDNILRPWQVKFLAAFGIHRGDQIVKAHHRSAKALANALRQYRRKHGMTPFRTKSCGMALQIWAKTSKSYVRSIRKQLLTGTSELKAPNTLYIISSFLEKMHEMHSPMPRNPNTVCNDEASL